MINVNYVASSSAIIPIKATAGSAGYEFTHLKKKLFQLLDVILFR